MAWLFDAPSGTYRNHALSTKVRRQAIADTTFMKYLTTEPGYGKKRGESVTITRILNLPLAARIAETDRLPSGRPAIQTKSVSPSLWGYKVPVTEFELNLTHFDLMNQVQSILRDQIALTMDVMAATAFKLTPVKYTPLSSGGEFVTDGSADSVSDRNWGVQDLRRIHDYMHGTLKVPPFKNGNYMAVFPTSGARGIKNDPEYKDWLAPSTSDPLRSGKIIPEIEGFSVVTTNHFDALANLVGASTTTGEALFFGADAAGLVSIMDPDLRTGMPEELGLFREVGWVAHLDAFLTWETPSLARVIHGTSA